MTPEERYARIDRRIEAIAMNLELTAAMAKASEDAMNAPITIVGARRSQAFQSTAPFAACAWALAIEVGITRALSRCRTMSVITRPAHLCSRRANCLMPCLHSRSPETAVRFSRNEVALDVEGVVGGSMNGEKSLG